MRSFVLFSGLFYKTLFVSLLISAAAKTVVNFRIDPIGPNVSLPSGRFAITHAENRHDGWPDYCDGLFGTISCNTSDLIGNVVAADNLEMIVFIALVALALDFQLGVVGKVLPLAAGAFAVVGARGLNTVRRCLEHIHDLGRDVLAVDFNHFGHHPFSGDAAGHEHVMSVKIGHGLAKPSPRRKR